MKNIKIKQGSYSPLEIDCREKNTVAIWMFEKGNSEVVHIKRENLKKVIEVLQTELDKNL